MIQDPAVILDKIHLGPEAAADILDRDLHLPAQAVNGVLPPLSMALGVDQLVEAF